MTLCFHACLDNTVCQRCQDTDIKKAGLLFRQALGNHASDGALQGVLSGLQPLMVEPIRAPLPVLFLALEYNIPDDVPVEPAPSTTTCKQGTRKMQVAISNQSYFAERMHFPWACITYNVQKRTNEHNSFVDFGHLCLTDS
jgi:hypothetical protein